MKFVNVLSISFLVFLFVVSCDTNEPPAQSTLVLKLEDVSCTEAWLQLASTNIQLPNNISILINGSVKKTFTLNSKDSLLYIDSLYPNQTYKLLAAMQQGNNTSNEVSVTTLDTTSHNFNWQTFEFGQHSTSVLYDVAIIDENNIWAVGEIYMNDSLGNPDPQRYNAVIWDGTKWSVIRIPYYFQGQPFYNPIQSVFAFSQNDIWFCGNGVVHWDGNNFIPIPIPANVWGPYQMNKIWGSSSNDLYVVGNSGNIAYYNGSNWTKIESGTTVDLLDVWGSTDGTIWVCGYNSSYSNTVLIKINNGKAIKLYEGSSNNQNNNLYIGPLSAGWTNSKFFTYLLNWGALYRQNNKTELDLSALSEPFFYDVAFDICANDKNDIIVSGESGMFGHYNGIRFYDLPDLRRNNIQYLANDIKDNLFITVGWDYSSIMTKAIIALGKRD